ncbi:MAG: biotin/lipoyl-binding protein [Candidatus Eisenbacteria bacterium]|nr:biotin/lipoyl-binding protein [Candidatus Eisenbacteria bacterium]
MKFWVTLEDREAEVQFRTDGDRLMLEIEGRRIEADFHRLPDGEVYSLIVDGRSHEVRVAPGAEALEVTVRGTMIPVEVRHPLEKMLRATQRAGRAAAGETVNAPMPGVVVALRVKAGDAVAAGQAVVVIEAMKMQNELAARYGGVVSEILVTERASVAAGQPLVRLKAPA